MLQFATLDYEKCSVTNDFSLLQDEDEIIVDFVPDAPLNVDTSVLLVGASTSLKRLEQALPQLRQ